MGKIYIHLHSFYKRFTATRKIGAYVWLTQNQTIFYKTFEDNVQVVALSMSNHKIQLRHGEDLKQTHTLY